MRASLVGQHTRHHWFTGFLAAACLVVAPSPAPPSPGIAGGGTITGHVLDQAGAPIQAAQIRIDGTAFGAVADSSGAYRIANVPTGTMDLTASFVGFKPIRAVGLRLRNGATVVQDFTLEAQAIDIGEIAVTSAVNSLVPRDAVTTRQPVTLNRNGGLHVRGGRLDAAGNYIDGVPASPNGRGGQFVGQSAGAATVSSTSSFEEASVTTGGTAAEFGNAMGAVQLPVAPGSEEYTRIYEHSFLTAASNPLSTFSIDVDAASYSNTRRFLTSGQAPPPDAVRIEEFINYFDYPYPEPKGPHPFSVTMEEGPCPWAPDHRLILVGLQARHIPVEEMPPSNLVFLIDVSGSMDSEDKLPLVQASLRLLVAQLRPEDRVALVVYAGAAGLVLPSTPGNDRRTILEAIDRLEAGGSTAGGAGIQLAYRVARENFLSRGNNRVILATDGDFNVGVSSEGDLVRMIEEYREQGTFLTVLGFGTGNLKDARMEQLADKGNGNYAYVDGIREARKVLIQEMGGTLFTVAKDVKLQLEFNPARVAQYRLIGYENRMLAKEDFADDRKDAGELGAGHAVTALYEVVPAGVPFALAPGDTLRYQTISASSKARYAREWLTVKLRYKRPDESRSRLLSEALTATEDRSQPSETFRFASAVAEFGLVLRNSDFKGRSSITALVARAEAALGRDPSGFRAEFVGLARRYAELTGQTSAGE